MNDIEQAEKTLAGLKQKREALVAHGHSLGEAQGRISYSAHTGDKAARAKLDKLNGEAALHDSELRSLDAAIEEARSRVVAAEYAQEQAAARQKAEEARKHVDELAKCFP
jgi:prophage tail gpP-like protein